MEVGYGKYRLEEVEVPSLYQLQKQKIDITLDENEEMSIEGNVLVYTTNIYQKLVKGNVYLSSFRETFSWKKNQYQYQKEAQPNVLFELISEEDIFVYDHLLYSKDEVVNSFSTNDKGKKELTLPLGNYCIQSKQTNERKCFPLSIEEKKEEKIEVFLEFLDKLSKVDLEYHNYDENGDDIEGSVIEIRNEKDEILDTRMTNEEGRIQLNEIPLGKYCFVQKKVSDKYLIHREKQCILVHDKKKLWEVSSMNQISKKVVELPDTLEDIPYFLFFIITIAIITIGGFIYQKVYSRS